MLPLASLTVPSSEDCTPLPAFAVVAPLVSSVSGQAWVQPFAWVQVIFPPFSEVSMYRVWPCPLTRTVPTPGTLVALIVAEAADEAPDGVLLPGELAAVLEDDEPHAATVAAVPSARPPASSQLLSGPRRCLALFLPIVLLISIFLTPFRSVQAADCLRISLIHSTGVRFRGRSVALVQAFGLNPQTVAGFAAGARYKSAACRS